MTPERVAFVAMYQDVLGEALVPAYCGPNGPQLIERFVSFAPDRARDLSRQLSLRILDDEDKLTEHGDSLRSVSRYIKDLQNRVLPAVQKEPLRQSHRIEATVMVAYLESHFKAMEFGIA